MVNRPRWLRLNIAALVALLLLTMLTTVSVAAKKRPNRPTADNPDGENTIAGSVWEFAAIHPTTGELFNFRFRAAAGVFYNGDNEIIGTSRPHKKKDVALLTFNKLSPAAGEYKVKHLKMGQWAGEDKHDDGTIWTLRLTCIDR